MIISQPNSFKRFGAKMVRLGMDLSTFPWEFLWEKFQGKGRRQEFGPGRLARAGPCQVAGSPGCLATWGLAIRLC